MSNLFSLDSPLMRTLTKAADLIWLNILFIVCCIPVFTLGAALSAMYSVTLKMSVNEEGTISQCFFKAFRENFKQATILWLILLGFGIFIILDFLVVPFLSGAAYEIAFWFLCVIGILYIVVFSFSFPLQCKFENPLKRTVMNALFLSIRHVFPTTILVSVLTAVPGLIVYFVPNLIIKVLPLVILILFSGIAFLNSKLLMPVFQKYIALQEEPDAQTEVTQA